MIRCGFCVVNPGYDSRKGGIETLANAVAARVGSALDKDRPVHIVGHSLGGLIARVLFQRAYFKRPGRIVLIGTPNHGSPLACKLVRFRAFRWLCGPVLRDLISGRADDPSLFSPPEGSIGIIAGDKATWMFGWFTHKRFFNGEPNDGMVSVASTRLEGAEDCLVLPVSHIAQPYRAQVHRQVEAFIRTGAFVREQKKALV